MAPKERLAVLITGTTKTYGSGALAERILLNALVERGSIARVPAPLPEVPPPEQVASDADLAAMAGFYGKNDNLLLIEPQADRTLTMYEYDGGQWRPSTTGLKHRVDGTFASDAQPLVAYWTFTAEGRRYLVLRQPEGKGHYLTETPFAQRVEPAAELSPAWQARANQRWLMVNEGSQSVLLASGFIPEGPLKIVEGLPGYLVGFLGIVDPTGSDTLARMFLKIPVEFGRDLNDVVVEMRNGEGWLRCGGFLFRPQASVPELVAGENLVDIGAEGLAEWRKLPVSGTGATLRGASAWKLYDADLKNLLASGEGDGNTGTHPKGAYLLLYGTPMTVITLTLSA